MSLSYIPSPVPSLMASPTSLLPLHAYLVMVTGCCATACIFFTKYCSSLFVVSSSRSSIYQEVGVESAQLGSPFASLTAGSSLYMHIVCSHQIHVDQRRSTVLNFPKTLCLGFNFFFNPPFPDTGKFYTEQEPGST